jgi:hypothetical protein
MRIFPTYLHAIDYIGGIFLLLIPNIFRFADLGGAPVWIPRIIGIVVLM